MTVTVNAKDCFVGNEAISPTQIISQINPICRSKIKGLGI